MSTEILSGIRVLALTQVWAGPLAARLLADLGADTIKIEYHERPDIVRMMFTPAGDKSQRVFDHGGYFHTMNRNQRGIALNLNSPEGKEAFLRLVKVSDVLIENYSPRVMHNWGLGYDSLRAVNPRLIMVSLSGFGSSGPYRDTVAYGNSIDPMSGLTYLTGYQDGPPIRSALSYPDPVASVHAAFAIMAALCERETSGQGQFIDVSMLEVATAFVGEAIGDYTCAGTEPERIGNRAQFHAPSGVFRCQGEDAWVAVAATNDREWQALCQVIGRKDLADDATLATTPGRKQREDEIDRAIAAWTAQQSKQQAMRALQQAGVPAGAVLTNKEELEDEQLRARGFFLRIPYPDGLGEFEHVGFPFKLSATPLQLRYRAPCLGEHNQEVLTELCGYTAEEVRQLEEKGIVGTAPSIPFQA